MQVRDPNNGFSDGHNQMDPRLILGTVVKGYLGDSQGIKYNILESMHWEFWLDVDTRDPNEMKFDSSS